MDRRRIKRITIASTRLVLRALARKTFTMQNYFYFFATKHVDQISVLSEEETKMILSHVVGENIVWTP